MLLQEYKAPILTREAVQEVIDLALDEMEYSPKFSSEAAVAAVLDWLSYSVCWNDDLEAFQTQLDAGYGPDDGNDGTPALERVEALSAQVQRLMTNKEAFAYRKTINEAALLPVIQKTYPDLLKRRPADMPIADFASLWAMVIAAYIVGGREYGRDEFLNCSDSIGAEPDVVATVIQAAKELHCTNYQESRPKRGGSLKR